MGVFMGVPVLFNLTAVRDTSAQLSECREEKKRQHWWEVPTKPSAVVDAENVDPVHTASGNVKCHRHSGNTLAVS